MAQARAQAPTATFSRKWDILLIVGVIFIAAGAIHISNMLTVGDWDFWTDWKDRQFWALITPTMTIIIPAALHYIGWTQLRIPIGATLATVLLVLVQILARSVNWGGWDYYPLNFTWPATMVMGGVILDCILMWTRGSFVLTAVIGGLTWGLLFTPQNWPMLSPFLQPVNFHGTTLTLADVQGFQYVRSALPEYQRIIEQGTLRAFLQQISWVVAIFSGFLSIFVYGIGVAIGKFIAVAPTTKFLKPRAGAKPLAPNVPDPVMSKAGA